MPVILLYSSNARFQKMNLNPCYLGNANFLNMTCEKNCTTYLPNPYFIMELTADITKIYDMLDSFWPFYDLKNLSNFIFLPITWANNLFQNWTMDTTCSASEDQLSRESKQTTNRKKAVILVVNKPDHFEHSELTYLGFSNDFSEIPVIESDSINFRSSSSNKTTWTSSKQLLKFTASTAPTYNNESYYNEFYNSTGKLELSGKGFVTIVAAPAAYVKYTTYTPSIVGGYVYYRNGAWYHTGYNYPSGKGIVSTDDGVTWSTNQVDVPKKSLLWQPCVDRS